MDRPTKVIIAFVAWTDVKGVTSQDMMRLVGGAYRRKTVWWQDGVQTVHEPVQEPMGMVGGQVMILSTLLPIGRNVAISQIYDNWPDWTHVLFVDADMSNYSEAHVLRMLNHDVDVVAPLMTRRVPPFSACCVPVEPGETDPYDRGLTNTPVGTLLDKMQDVGANGLLECYHVGTAFTLIKREVMEAICEDTPDGKVWFNTDRLPRPGIKDEFNALVSSALQNDWGEQSDPEKVLSHCMLKSFELGLGSRKGSPVMGEDVIFCRAARAAGFKVFVDSQLTVCHIGDRPYDIKDGLAVMKAERDRLAALGINIGQCIHEPKLPHLAA